MVVTLDFLLGDFLFVDGAPGVEDVGQYKWYQQRYIEHGAQRELT